MSAAKQTKGIEKIKFKYFPLTFIKSRAEKKRQVLNTVIFKYIEDRYNDNRELSDLIESTQYGYNASALKKGENKFLRISDIKEGEVDWQNVPFCNCSDEKTYMLNVDDILIARTGGTTGKSFLIQSAPSGAIYAGYLIRLRCKKNINPRYIYSFLNSYAYWPQISELKGGSAQPNVNAEKLKKLIIPNCPLEIQDKIVSFIENNEIDIEDLKRKINKIDRSFEYFDRNKTLFSTQEINLNNLRQQILQDAVSGKQTKDWREDNPDVEPASKLLKRIKDGWEIKKEKTFPPIDDREFPFDLPEKWMWTRLGEIVKISSGDFLASYQMSKDGDIPVFGGNGINGFHNHENVNEEKIVIGRVGAYCGSIHLTPQKAWVTDNAFVVDFSTDNINQNWLVLLLKSLNLGKASFKGAQPVISGKRIYPMLLSFPPLLEQKAIVAKVASLMQKCDQIESKMNQSKQNNDLLL